MYDILTYPEMEAIIKKHWPGTAPTKGLYGMLREAAELGLAKHLRIEEQQEPVASYQLSAPIHPATSHIAPDAIQLRETIGFRVVSDGSFISAAEFAATERNAELLVSGAVVRVFAPDAAAIQAEVQSIASNHDAMIILTQSYPREAVIKVVDAHTSRQIADALAKASPAIAPEASELPLLPEPHLKRGDGLTHHFTKKQMRAYARAAIAQFKPMSDAELVAHADAAAIAMHRAAPVKVAGLGRIWNEEDGFLELQFKDEAAAQAFMQQYEPSVDCRDMPDMHRAAAAKPVSDPMDVVDNISAVLGEAAGRKFAAVLAQQAAAEPVPTCCSCPSGDGSLRWPCPVHPAPSKENK